MRRSLLFSATIHFCMWALLLGTSANVQPALAKPLAQNESSPCNVNADRTVSPGFILRGERAKVSLDLGIECPGEEALHIVLVLDASGSMAGPR